MNMERCPKDHFTWDKQKIVRISSYNYIYTYNVIIYVFKLYAYNFYWNTIIVFVSVHWNLTKYKLNYLKIISNCLDEEG